MTGMPGVILAVIERPEVAARVLAAAACLAELTGARRINVLAVRMPPVDAIMPSEEVLTRQKESRIRARGISPDRRIEGVIRCLGGNIRPSCIR